MSGMRVNAILVPEKKLLSSDWLKLNEPIFSPHLVAIKL
jgi:hypothetical protein